MSEAPVVVAVDGPDNSGKTTHIHLLAAAFPHEYHATRGVHHYDPEWPLLNGADLAQWWFENCPSEELARRLFHGYAHRSRLQDSQDRTILLDRGLATVESAAIASIAVKEDCGLDEAESIAGRIRHEVLGSLPVREDIRLVLQLAGDLDAAVAASLERETTADSRYQRFQRLLHAALRNRTTEHTVIDCDGRDVVDVHRTVREVLSRHGLPAGPFLVHVDNVIGLGGLSESGKSTAGEYLRREHATGRLKLGYLVDTAASRAGIFDPYTLAPGELAALVVAELDRFAKDHHFIRNFTVESLHRPELTLAMSSLLGNRFHVVYLETDEGTRRRRSIVDTSEFARNDRTKHARGAASIAGFSDVLVDNSHDRLNLDNTLDATINQWRSRPAHEVVKLVPTRSLSAPAPLTEAAELALECLTRELDSGLLLAAVTGSVGFGTASAPHSDLDIFAVTEPGYTRAIGAVMRRLWSTLPVKLGLTVITRGELQSLRCDSRTLSNLFFIGRGILPCQYFADDLILPIVDGGTQHSRTLVYLARAIHELRRAVYTADQEPYKLFKSLLNVPKMIMRLNGLDVTAPDDIAAGFHRLFGDGPNFTIPGRQEWSRMPVDQLHQTAIALVDWVEARTVTLNRSMTDPRDEDIHVDK